VRAERRWRGPQSRQVGRGRLADQDRVTGLLGQYLIGHLEGGDRRAPLGEAGNGAVERIEDRLVEHGATMVLQDADPQSAQAHGLVRHGPRGAARPRRRCRRVGGIAPADAVQQQGAIVRRPRHQANVIERPREREHAGSRHAAEGRLQAGHAAQRRRHACRPAAVGPDRAAADARGDRHGAAPAGSAGHARWVPWVAARPMVRVLRRGAQAELVQVRLAQQDRAGATQPPPHGRIDGGRPAQPFGLARARRRGVAAHVDQVLYSERHAVQRAAVAPTRQLPLGAACRVEHSGGVEAEEGMEHRLHDLGAGDGRLGHLDR